MSFVHLLAHSSSSGSLKHGKELQNLLISEVRASHTWATDERALQFSLDQDGPVWFSLAQFRIVQFDSVQFGSVRFSHGSF